MSLTDTQILLIRSQIEEGLLDANLIAVDNLTTPETVRAIRASLQLEWNACGKGKLPVPPPSHGGTPARRLSESEVQMRQRFADNPDIPIDVLAGENHLTYHQTWRVLDRDPSVLTARKLAESKEEEKRVKKLKKLVELVKIELKTVGFSWRSIAFKLGFALPGIHGELLGLKLRAEMIRFSPDMAELVAKYDRDLALTPTIDEPPAFDDAPSLPPVPKRSKPAIPMPPGFETRFGTLNETDADYAWALTPDYKEWERARRMAMDPDLARVRAFRIANGLDPDTGQAK